MKATILLILILGLAVSGLGGRHLGRLCGNPQRQCLYGALCGQCRGRSDGRPGHSGLANPEGKLEGSQTGRPGCGGRHQSQGYPGRSLSEPLSCKIGAYRGFPGQPPTTCGFGQAFARTMAPELLRDVVNVETAPIHLVVGEGESHGSAELQAGNLARIKARPIGAKDHLCGNEHVYYPPLTELSHAMPAYTITDEFSGSGLGVNWRINGKTNAFVGHFSYDSALQR